MKRVPIVFFGSVIGGIRCSVSVVWKLLFHGCSRTVALGLEVTLNQVCGLYLLPSERRKLHNSYFKSEMCLATYYPTSAKLISGGSGNLCRLKYWNILVRGKPFIGSKYLH